MSVLSSAAAPAPARTHPGSVAPRTGVGQALRVLGIELRDEMLAIVREPTALFFGVAMPVAFYAMFTSFWGSEATQSTTVATSMLATFGTFGVLGVTLFNPGIGIADDRERGWLRAKQVTATPLPLTLAAKCLATIPYSVGVLAAMTVVAALSGSLQLAGPGVWIGLVIILVLGALPFGLLGLTVGLLASPNASTAILQALLIPMAVASGLWFPLEQLPAFVRSIAPVLPAYHLAQLGSTRIVGGAAGGHVLYLLGFTVVAALAAGVTYRRSYR